MPDNRTAILRVMAAMPGEAFGWLVLACYSSAATAGPVAHIWPDNMTRFSTESKRSIAALKRASQTYIDQAISDLGNRRLG